MSPFHTLVLAASAALGGALNSVAGGGSFFTFPALLFVGIAPVTANATSAVALWPAALSASLAYRRELEHSKHVLVPLAAASAVGGLIGAVLLLRTPNTTFARAVPYLLLGASLIFTFGRKIAAGWRDRASPSSVCGVLFQFVIAVYGGYFGGGMGIVMLATLSLMGMTNIHAMNALKMLLGTLINLVAIVIFIAAGVVAWQPGIVMIVGATCGGYAGARVARRLDPEWVRRFALAAAWIMTALFFWKAYVHPRG